MSRTRDPRDLLPLTPMALEILLALANGERHGYDVMLAIEERTGGRVSPNPGTLYRAIDRLARAGVIDAELRRTGRTELRRVFRLSTFGTRVADAELARLADQVDAARSSRLLRKPGKP